MPKQQAIEDPVRDLSRLHGPARKEALEALYHAYNHARYRAGDPVSYVWQYPDPADREVAAWIAAALAYGRVASILNSLDDLSRRWEHQPAAFLRQASDREMRKALSGFVHRWTRGEHVLGMLAGWRELTSSQDLPARLAAHPHGYRAALDGIRTDLLACAPEDPDHLFPNPAGPGACKRLAMWLRWMTRKDEIDPGLWADTLAPARLWVPLDTHMFRISRRLGLTRRKSPDGEAARRITAAYARICPEDPLRYDFGITRLGMKQPM
ncbi:MAG: TIGR02757 family protein [Verrucomicrobia bacterium]|nr:TIGR02757 family protein [Verrucomicrobiota bacterium]MCH8511283.1 TIGR02757 family protein [Kiritimatiellia bacterium]